MNDHTSIYARIAFCIFIAGLTLYLYIDDLNKLTGLRLAIPAIVKEVKSIHDENIQIQYEIEMFESPIHLMELLRKPEFSHLHYPYVKDVIILKNASDTNVEPK
jgi:hypothetical protein